MKPPESEVEDYLQDLPDVTDQMLCDILNQTEGHVMTIQERQRQLVSFVYGNDLEGGSTLEQVCKHLNIPSELLG